MGIDYAALDEKFRHHPPGEDRATLHDAVRAAGRAMALAVMQVAPEGRERSLALTKIEEAVMWASTGIAREES